MPGQFGNYGDGGGRGGGGGRRGPRTIITDPEHEQFRKLFIGGLSYDTTEETLRAHFETWGEICDCVVMKDPNSKRSRGFGFITYEKSFMIEEAQSNRPHKIDGREVETKRAMPREESSNSESQMSVKKMFVGGLKEGTVEDQIRECFEPFGEIEKIDLISDKNSGRNRGFCFVTFKDYDSVDKCVLKKRFNLNEKDVEVKKAVSKSDQPGGGRGGGRGGMRGGGNNWNQGGGNFGGGFNQGFHGGGGYSDGGFGGNQGGYGGGGYGGGGGGYGGGGSNFGGGGGGYNQGGGGGGWSGQNFGSNYGENYGGGAMKGGGYQQRGQGPYGGGGYGGGGYGGGGGGGYGGGNRR